MPSRACSTDGPFVTDSRGAVQACFEVGGYVDRVKEELAKLEVHPRWVLPSKAARPVKIDPFPTVELFDETDLPALPRHAEAKVFVLVVSGTSTSEGADRANEAEAAYFCVNGCTRAEERGYTGLWRGGPLLDALLKASQACEAALDRGQKTCSKCQAEQGVPKKEKRAEEEAFDAITDKYPNEYLLPYGDLARRIVQARIRGKSSPNCLGVVVLNFCHSHGVHQAMASMEADLRNVGLADKTFVMSTTGQWPGSITPRLMSAALKAVSNTDPTQKALRTRLATACEINYDSYKAAGMLHGRGAEEEPYVSQLKMSTI